MQIRVMQLWVTVMTGVSPSFWVGVSFEAISPNFKSGLSN